MLNQREVPRLEETIDADRVRPARHPTVAVLVAHGMGQQVKFETLNDVCYGLGSAAVRAGFAFERPSVRLLRHRVAGGDCEYFPRAELTLRLADHEPLDVHVYEAYWAPLTEGAVTLRDVASFLVWSGVSGIRLTYGGFSRIIDGQWHTFPRSGRTVLRFVVALLFVLSLIALNVALTAITAMGAAQALRAAWPQQQLVAAMTQWLLLFEATIVAFGLLAFVMLQLAKRFRARHAHEPRARWTLPSVVRGFLHALAWVAVGSTIVAGGGVAYALVTADTLGGADARPALVSILIVVVAIGVSFVIRWFLVQFLGDVVVYVTSYAVNRFHEVRGHIQKAVGKVARFVYGAEQYSGIVLLGHSLGAVIAYDMFNAVLNEGTSHNAADRTSLITFGAPLDKTAFVFRSQKSQKAPIREALATEVQAMLVDPSRRPASWINIWSPSDWISGELDYYGGPIDNLRDPEAVIPLVAHVQYWSNALVFDQMLKRIVI